MNRRESVCQEALRLLSISKTIAESYGQYARGGISIGAPSPSSIALGSSHHTGPVSPLSNDTTGQTFNEAIVLTKDAIRRLSNSQPSPQHPDPERAPGTPSFSPSAFLAIIKDCEHDLLPALALFSRIAMAPAAANTAPSSSQLPHPPAFGSISQTSNSTTATTAGASSSNSSSNNDTLYSSSSGRSYCRIWTGQQAVPTAGAESGSTAGTADPDPNVARQAAIWGAAACHLLLALSHSDPRDTLVSASDALRCLLQVVPAIAASAPDTTNPTAAAGRAHSLSSYPAPGCLGTAVTATAGAADPAATQTQAGRPYSGICAATDPYGQRSQAPDKPLADPSPARAPAHVQVPSSLRTATAAAASTATAAAVAAAKVLPTSSSEAAGPGQPGQSARRGPGLLIPHQQEPAADAAASTLALLELWLGSLLSYVQANPRACRTEIAGVLPQLVATHRQLRARLRSAQAAAAAAKAMAVQGAGLSGATVGAMFGGGDGGEGRGGLGPGRGVAALEDAGVLGSSRPHGSGGVDGGDEGLCVLERLVGVLEPVAAAIQQGIAPFDADALGGQAVNRGSAVPPAAPYGRVGTASASSAAASTAPARMAPTPTAAMSAEAACSLLATALEAARLLTVNERLRGGSGGLSRVVLSGTGLSGDGLSGGGLGGLSGGGLCGGGLGGDGSMGTSLSGGDLSRGSSSGGARSGGGLSGGGLGGGGLSAGTSTGGIAGGGPSGEPFRPPGPSSLPSPAHPVPRSEATTGDGAAASSSSLGRTPPRPARPEGGGTSCAPAQMPPAPPARPAVSLPYTETGRLGAASPVTTSVSSPLWRSITGSDPAHVGGGSLGASGSGGAQPTGPWDVIGQRPALGPRWTSGLADGGVGAGAGAGAGSAARGVAGPSPPRSIFEGHGSGIGRASGSGGGNSDASGGNGAGGDRRGGGGGAGSSTSKSTTSTSMRALDGGSGASCSARSGGSSLRAAGSGLGASLERLLPPRHPTGETRPPATLGSSLAWTSTTTTSSAANTGTCTGSGRSGGGGSSASTSAAESNGSELRSQGPTGTGSTAPSTSTLWTASAAAAAAAGARRLKATSAGRSGLPSLGPSLSASLNSGSFNASFIGIGSALSPGGRVSSSVPGGRLRKYDRASLFLEAVGVTPGMLAADGAAFRL